MDIAGSCHCGNITYSLRWPEDAVKIPARSCTFCVVHGGVDVESARRCAQTSLIRAPWRATLSDRVRQLPGTPCGVAPLVTSLIEGKLYAVVNVNLRQHRARARC
jgi:hypothetical protein